MKAKLDYHMSMLFAYMAGGEGGGGRGFKMFCQRGSEFFYLLCVCVCGTSPSVKRNTDPLLLINTTSLIFFKILLARNSVRLQSL